MATRIEKEGPLAVCLSLLYERQDWLWSSRERTVGVGSVADHKVRPPVQERIRKPYWTAGYVDENDTLFAREALDLFDFGGDFSSKNQSKGDGHEGKNQEGHAPSVAD